MVSFSSSPWLMAPTSPDAAHPVSFPNAERSLDQMGQILTGHPRARGQVRQPEIAHTAHAPPLRRKFFARPSSAEPIAAVAEPTQQHSRQSQSQHHWEPPCEPPTPRPSSCCLRTSNLNRHSACIPCGPTFWRPGPAWLRFN